MQVLIRNHINAIHSVLMVISITHVVHLWAMLWLQRRYPFLLRYFSVSSNKFNVTLCSDYNANACANPDCELFKVGHQQRVYSSWESKSQRTSLTIVNAAKHLEKASFAKLFTKCPHSSALWRHSGQSSNIDELLKFWNTPPACHNKSLRFSKTLS